MEIIRERERAEHGVICTPCTDVVTRRRYVSTAYNPARLNIQTLFANMKNIRKNIELKTQINSYRKRTYLDDKRYIYSITDGLSYRLLVNLLITNCCVHCKHCAQRKTHTSNQ